MPGGESHGPGHSRGGSRGSSRGSGSSSSGSSGRGHGGHSPGGGFNKQGADPSNKGYSSTGAKARSKAKAASDRAKSGKSYDKGITESFSDLGRSFGRDVSRVGESISRGFNDAFSGSSSAASKADRSYGAVGFSENIAEGNFGDAFGNIGDTFGDLGDTIAHEVDSFFSGDPTAKDTRPGYEQFADSVMDSIGLGDEDSQASFADRVQKEIDDFTASPMDYAADLVDNSFVGTAMSFTGLGLTKFGVKAVDTVTDLVQGETTLGQASLSLAGTAINSTPIGAALGPFRGMVGNMAMHPDVAGETFAGGVSGFMGAGTVGQAVGSFTNNPIAKSIAASVGGSIAKSAAKSYAKANVGQAGISRAPNRPTESKSSLTAYTGSYRAPSIEATTSPLASSGERARRSTEALQQPAYAGLYSDTISQLHDYGLNPQQSPYYGLS